MTIHVSLNADLVVVINVHPLSPVMRVHRVNRISVAQCPCRQFLSAGRCHLRASSTADGAPKSGQGHPVPARGYPKCQVFPAGPLGQHGWSSFGQFVLRTVCSNRCPKPSCEGVRPRGRSLTCVVAAICPVVTPMVIWWSPVTPICR